MTRRVERWGDTKTAAQAALQEALRARQGGVEATPLRPTSRLRDAVEISSAMIAERREDSTAGTYQHWVDSIVLPRLGELRLHECDVGRLDVFFSELERERVEAVDADGRTTTRLRLAANTRRSIRSIVSGVLTV